MLYPFTAKPTYSIISYHNILQLNRSEMPKILVPAKFQSLGEFAVCLRGLARLRGGSREVEG
jgi:hypothetical protein